MASRFTVDDVLEAIFDDDFDTLKWDYICYNFLSRLPLITALVHPVKPLWTDSEKRLNLALMPLLVILSCLEASKQQYTVTTEAINKSTINKTVKSKRQALEDKITEKV